jgi:large subunit ribosomal protein L1
MGKKRATEIGSAEESQVKEAKKIKLEQKKLREGLPVGRQGKATVKKEESAPVQAAVVAQPETTEAVKAIKAPHIRSKAYKTAKAKVDMDKTYTLADGLKLLRDISLTKFDPTVELHLTLKSKDSLSSAKQIDLPHSTGKTKRYAVATDEVVAKIEAGKIDFDVLLASPAQMGKLVKLAKVLGPKGLMPNPKNGTVVADPEKAAKDMASKATLTLKAEKDSPTLHTMVGKLSMKDAVLTDNIKAVLAAVPNQTRKVVLKSTMSPAIKIQA